MIKITENELVPFRDDSKLVNEGDESSIFLAFPYELYHCYKIINEGKHLFIKLFQLLREKEMIKLE